MNMLTKSFLCLQFTKHDWQVVKLTDLLKQGVCCNFKVNLAGLCLYFACALLAFYLLLQTKALQTSTTLEDNYGNYASHI